MSTLIWKDLRHHASEWLWSLLVATVGGTIVGVVITSWWSAVQWSLAHPDGPYMLASNILGSNMVGYIGISTAIVISTTLGLTVTAQQRSYALWKVLGIPGRRIRSVILWQVCAVGLVGGLLGGLLALPTARVYLLTWREFNLFPDDLPLSMPLFGIPATMLVTALFSVLGGLGAARRAANVPEMQALREATSPRSRTKLWQWIAAGFFLIPVVLMPILINLPPEALHSDYTPEMPDVPTEAATTDFESPGDRAVLGGGIGLMVTLAALFIPNWTVRPLLIGWTSLIPGRSPAWFAARANARHRSAFSLTTIVPFAIAVAMTGVFHTVANAGRAAGGMHGGVNGFLTIMVPIFFVAGAGGIANIAMVGRTRRQEGALLGVIGARSGTILGSTILEGAIYAITGILFGLAVTLLSATSAALMSGGGMEVFIGSIPVTTPLPAIGASLVLAITTTWLPAQLDRRPMMESLRQPV